MNVIDISRPTTCIVTLKQRAIPPREIFYQVTVCPENVSPSKRFIRFGITHGDEIVGWQPVDAVIIHEVLHEHDTDVPQNELMLAGVTLEAGNA